MKQTEQRIRARVRAREAAGLSPEQAAKKARIGLAYLKRIERCGCDCYQLSLELARLYQCRVDLFI